MRIYRVRRGERGGRSAGTERVHNLHLHSRSRHAIIVKVTGSVSAAICSEETSGALIVLKHSQKTCFSAVVTQVNLLVRIQCGG